ncbi:cell division protein PerM [Agrococcus carbonis]|uniref:cell division protein PerM n=1 Tax=Agrococcus carbonis TaxID=684552 RepID=UPI000B84DA3E|nr:DUF6350 family protein [Agrococcus carbonis]
MRRVWAGIGQAVESAAIAAAGLVVCALVMLAVWGVDQGFDGDPLLQWRIAADAWLLGHGVDLGITPGREAVIAVGAEQVGQSFVVTLGAWGIGLLTLWLHWRSGRRLASLPILDASIAAVLGAAATGAVGLVAGMSAQHATAAPNLVQSALLPAAVALVGMGAALLAAHGHDWLAAAARGLTLEAQWLRTIRAALRTGLGATAGVLGVGALLVGVGLLLRFTDGLLLLESLGVTHVGVVVVFLVQLALAPVAIVWGASWAIGPGFMVGAGSSVSPLGTDLGPVPALPLLAAIDPGAEPWMSVVVALPVLAAVVVGAFARQSTLAGTPERPVHWWELVVAALGGAVLAGALLGLAAMLSTGAAGPGRLGETGPDAVLVAAWGALEIGVGLLLGMLAGGRGSAALAVERGGSSIREVFGFGTSRGAADAAGGAGSGEAADAPAEWREDEAGTQEVAPVSVERDAAAPSGVDEDASADADDDAATATATDADRDADTDPAQRGAAHPEPEGDHRPR